MGNSFGNVQVLVGDQSVGKVWEAIVELYRRWMAVEGYAEVQDDG